MEGMWHASDVIKPPMEAIVDAARRRTVPVVERSLEFVLECTQFGNILCGHLLDRATHQLCFKQQPELQDLAGCGRIERHDAHAAIRIPCDIPLRLKEFKRLSHRRNAEMELFSDVSLL